MKTSLILLFLSFAALPLLAQSRQTKAPIDPDDAYKNNCMRCHSSVQSYSPSQTATVVLHMRVRANLTAEETQAILRYLQETAAKPSARQHSEKSQANQKRELILVTGTKPRGRQ